MMRGRRWASPGLLLLATALLSGCSDVLLPGSRCPTVRWTQLGPDSVRVLSLAQTPHGIWAGTQAHGVYRQVQGRHWEPLGLGGVRVRSLLAVDGRVLAGRHSIRDPLLATEDGGRTWLPPEVEVRASATRMAQDPQNPLRIIRAGVLQPEAESLDGGRTWQPLPYTITVTSIYAMLMLPGDRIITAGMGSFFNAEIFYYEAGESRLPDPRPWWDEMVNSVMAGLAQDPADPETIYAGDLFGLYVSRNGGRGWEAVLHGRWEGAPFGMGFDGGHLYIATVIPDYSREGPDPMYPSSLGFYRYQPGGRFCELNAPRAAGGAETMLHVGRGEFLVGTRGSGVWHARVR